MYLRMANSANTMSGRHVDQHATRVEVIPVSNLSVVMYVRQIVDSYLEKKPLETCGDTPTRAYHCFWQAWRQTGSKTSGYPRISVTSHPVSMRPCNPWMFIGIHGSPYPHRVREDFILQRHHWGR